MTLGTTHRCQGRFLGGCMPGHGPCGGRCECLPPAHVSACRMNIPGESSSRAADPPGFLPWLPAEAEACSGLEQAPMAMCNARPAPQADATGSCFRTVGGLLHRLGC